jgi:hypothetical protein
MEGLMNSSNTFRIVLVVFALLIGSYAIASSFAALESLDRPTFPADPTKSNLPSVLTVPNWLEAASPFRSDLETNHALIVALQAIESGRERSTAEQAARHAEARSRLKQTLSTAPYNPELWLALAVLQAQHDPRDLSLAEALKMAYFTAPNDVGIMPARLDTVTSFDALADPDIKELARGDVRLMLTRQPEMKTAVISAYRRASSRGKAFLEEAVQSIDPSFLPTLRG